jgi:hypothetical protein
MAATKSETVISMSEQEYINSAKIQENLESYFLLFWSGKYVLKEMQEGVIWKNNTRYHVCFAPNLSRGKIMRNSPLQQYKLSFRKAKKHLKLPSFVFISYPT